MIRATSSGLPDALSVDGATSPGKGTARRYEMDASSDLRTMGSPLPGLFRFAGRVSRALPARPRDAVLTHIGGALAESHPDVLRRLASYGGRTLLIAIEDMDLELALTFGAPVSLGLAATAQQRRAHATIRGTWPALLALLEGRADGDALFFSRAITIEGDTDLMLAIRNAVDGMRIDLLRDVAAACGPFAAIAQRAISGVMGAGLRAAQLLDAGHRALLEPAMARCGRLGDDLAQTRQQLAALAVASTDRPRRRCAAAND